MDAWSLCCSVCCFWSWGRAASTASIASWCKGTRSPWSRANRHTAMAARLREARRPNPRARRGPHSLGGRSAGPVRCPPASPYGSGS
jgi:hypothetical protein